MALKLNMARGPGPRPVSSAVEELPGRLLGTRYRHSAAPAWSRLGLSRRKRIFGGLAEAITAQKEDLGVLYQAVGDGRGDGGVVENIAPVGEGCVGGNYRGTLMGVPVGYDLVREIGVLLVSRER